MNVTPPSAVIEQAYGSLIKSLVDRIEKDFSSRKFCTERDGQRVVSFYLNEGEWFENVVKDEITRMYKEAGWLDVSFAYFDRIEFYIKTSKDEALTDGTATNA